MRGAFNFLTLGDTATAVTKPLTDMTTDELVELSSEVTVDL